MTKDLGKQKRFSMRHLRSLSSPEEIIEYAQAHLTCLGKGSSRTVFAIKSKVLKVAINERGYAQNKAELLVAENRGTRPSLSLISDYRQDDNGNVVWLLSQSVRTISDCEEFKSLSGFSWEVYTDTIRAFAKANAQNDLETITSDISNQYSTRLVRLKSEGDERNARYYETLLSEMRIMKSSRFFAGIISAMKVNRLMPGDILELDHYGKTPSGDIVLYDYGFTEDIAKKFYPKPADTSAGKAKVYQLNGNEALITNPSLKTIPRRRKAG